MKNWETLRTQTVPERYDDDERINKQRKTEGYSIGIPLENIRTHVFGIAFRETTIRRIGWRAVML